MTSTITTSTINAIIVDDEEKSRGTLSLILNKYCSDINIIGMAESVDEAYGMIIKQNPNVLFLDIEMPHASGFELLKRLPNINFEIIFVTGFDHYALQAIKFHALDYLLKPIDIDELIIAVNKVKTTLSNKINAANLTGLLKTINTSSPVIQQIAIPTPDGREFIAINEIIRCEADGIYTWFYLENNKKIISSKNLGYYEKLLPNTKHQDSNPFFRIHHRHLINLSFIKKFNRKENFIEMIDASKLTIAQRRKARFFSILKNSNLL